MTPTSSPFVEELFMEEIPKVRLPTHITYNGTTDPRDHVISYEQQMFLSLHSEACWCKYYPTTLTGVVGEWFRTLPKGSIDSFIDLSEKFCVQFVRSNRPERTTAELTAIQQERGESLLDFMDRTEEFNKAAAKLKSSSEPRDTKTNQSKPEGSSRKGKEKQGARDGSPKKEGLHKNDEKWKLLGKLRSNPLHRNKNKWFEFQDEIGHNTEECNQLKDNIKDLVRRGYLKQYLADQREEKEKARNCKPQEQPQKRIYEATWHKKNDILEVFGGQRSNHASKKHLRALSHQVNFNAVGEKEPHPPNMTFTADDCLGVQYEHEDPLVISMDLNNHNVHRVLVDVGSVVNIIFRNCFEQLILEEGEESLTKFSYPLIGFNGSAAVPRGNITLPVTACQGQAARNVREEFLVIDCDLVYNAIMGRTMIHKMQAIPSTYHQMMIYVSDTGFA
ncbi:uncharacterized protein [Spinacia oleracea]|uniref:Retrotransposon gag domain-containing protein n=1 Tax=Spinacia oleracea TaxID=3562 RepID=A0ABM3QYF6_SPIOL|nr:uncharacterized protein LOC130463338 [Spinacia oleracea]